MLNREKYAKEIVEIACNRQRLAISNGKPTACEGLSCEDCDLHDMQIGCDKLRIQEWASNEYVEPPVDWSKVAVDTPIFVRDFGEKEWRKRYFAKYEDGKVFAWLNGATSWSVTDINNVTYWNMAKLAESEE